MTAGKSHHNSRLSWGQNASHGWLSETALGKLAIYPATTRATGLLSSFAFHHAGWYTPLLSPPKIWMVLAELIFVTNITNYIGEKKLSCGEILEKFGKF